MEVLAVAHRQAVAVAEQVLLVLMPEIKLVALAVSEQIHSQPG
jgi:hypothetical protein